MRDGKSKKKKKNATISKRGSRKRGRRERREMREVAMAKAMAMAMVERWSNRSIVIVVGGVLLLLMLLLILLLILLAYCKPWICRVFSRSSRSRTIKVDDLERPLVSEDPSLIRNPINEFARNNAAEETSHLTDGNFSLPRTHGLAYKQRIPSKTSQLTQSGSFVLNVEDLVVGQTLRVPPVTNDSIEELKSGREEDLSYDSKFDSENNNFRKFVHKGSCLTLEVISGPSRGLRCSVQSSHTSRLPLTLGRVSPSDLLLKDSEVSGKHALINWNLNKSKWELVDMGSLNGTLLNSQAVHYPDSGSRHWGEPTVLENGDVITLGTTSKIFVHITSQTEYQIPFGVGVASDPMALRRGGKKLPMEDVCYYQWPLHGTDQFGLFGICDGHGGASAATSASKILPEMVASILSDTVRRTRVLSKCDASDVLRDAFLQTEARMNHYYEGCTATLLLVWADSHENFFAQCANVGDSACVINIEEAGEPLKDGETRLCGKQIKMTEDHRITSCSERLRIQEAGEPLKDGETRLCGLNLARMLGDKFLKQQEVRFSSEPYISQVVYINQESRGFALLASDGFWDVVNFKKAIHLVHRTREKNARDSKNTAEKIANILLSEARSQRTKDNTSIIFLDFDTSRISCKPDS